MIIAHYTAMDFSEPYSLNYGSVSQYTDIKTSYI
jgi:hypothetical protein